MTDTSPTLATRIVDALFDQWEADHGLSKSKAIDRVQEILTAYTTQPSPYNTHDGHPKAPCDEEQSPYTAGPSLKERQQADLERQQQIVEDYIKATERQLYTFKPGSLFGQLQIDPPINSMGQKGD